MIGEYGRHNERVESIKRRYRNSTLRFLVVFTALITLSVSVDIYTQEYLSQPPQSLLELCRNLGE